MKDVPAGYRPFMSLKLNREDAGQHLIRYDAMYVCAGTAKETKDIQSTQWADQLVSSSASSGDVIIQTTLTCSGGTAVPQPY